MMPISEVKQIYNKRIQPRYMIDALLGVGLGIWDFLMQVGVSLAANMKSLSSTAHSGKSGLLPFVGLLYLLKHCKNTLTN
jgi:hypothetical protein